MKDHLLSRLRQLRAASRVIPYSLGSNAHCAFYWCRTCELYTGLYHKGRYHFSVVKDGTRTLKIACPKCRDRVARARSTTGVLLIPGLELYLAESSEVV